MRRREESDLVIDDMLDDRRRRLIVERFILYDVVNSVPISLWEPRTVSCKTMRIAYCFRMQKRERPRPTRMVSAVTMSQGTKMNEIDRPILVRFREAA